MCHGFEWYGSNYQNAGTLRTAEWLMIRIWHAQSIRPVSIDTFVFLNELVPSIQHTESILKHFDHFVWSAAQIGLYQQWWWCSLPCDPLRQNQRFYCGWPPSNLFLEVGKYHFYPFLYHFDTFTVVYYHQNPSNTISSVSSMYPALAPSGLQDRSTSMKEEESVAFLNGIGFSNCRKKRSMCVYIYIYIQQKHT